VRQDHSELNRLTVYRTEDGVLLRTFGGHGSGPGQFDRIGNLCMTARDTVVVSEEGNKRIQEVTLAGKHGQVLPSGRACLRHGLTWRRAWP